MSKWTMGATVFGLMMMSGGDALAQSSGSMVPDRAFFAGAGVSANWTSYPNQDVFGQGLANIYDAGGALYAQGQAGGSTSPYMAAQTDISPVLQLGYFQRFAGSDWLWGAKFTYNYLGASTTQENFLIPQAGGYTGSISGALEGNVYARQYTMKVDNQFELIPFLGYAFDRGYVYGGAGPSLTRMKSELNGLIGFADLFGQTSDITGAPDSFSTTNWVWGASFVAGATYFLAPGWFLDVNYAYALNGTATNRFHAPFSTVHNGLTFTGIAFGHYSGTADVQTLSLTINKTF
ncbi:outer membrane protein [Xanthobacteraceae bacterium A53D]